MAERTICCAEHGDQDATFVCQHILLMLRDRVPRGFFWADDSDVPRPDAWCEACNVAVAQTGGEWTAESEALAGVTMICGACYDRAKRVNAGESDAS